MKNVILLLFIFLLNIVNCYAQFTINQLIVTVKDDSTKARIPNATINILNQKKIYTTNQNGISALPSPNNQSILEIAALGYSPRRYAVNTSEVKDTIFIYMHILIKDLSEVVVLGKKSPIKVGIDNITVDASIYHGSNQANSLNLLKLVPGITIDGDGLIKLHGNSNYRVYVDNKPTLMTSQELASWLKSQPISNVRDVQIFSAANARTDGDNTAGILNINLKRNKLDGYNGNVSVGLGTLNNNYVSANVSAKRKKYVSSVQLGYYTHSNNGDIQSYRIGRSIDNKQYVLTEFGNRNSSDRSFNMSGDISTEIDTTLSLSARINFNKFKLASLDQLFYQSQSPVSYLTEQFYLLQTREADNYSITGSLGLDKRWNKNSNGSLYFLTSNGNGLINNGFSPSDTIATAQSYRQSYNEYALQGQLVHKSSHLGTFELGAKEIFKLTLADYTNADSVMYIDKAHFYQNISAIYAQHTFHHKVIEIQYGLRAEYYNSYLTTSSLPNYNRSFFNIFPNITLLHNLNERQTIKLSLFRKTNRPGLTYLNTFQDKRNPKDYIVGNNELVPEYKDGIEMAYNYSKDAFSFNNSFYIYNTQNAIVSYALPAFDNVIYTTYGNVGKDFRVGVNSELSYNNKSFGLNSQITVDYYSVSNSYINQNNSGLRLVSSTQASFRTNNKWYFEVSGDLETKQILLSGTQSGWNYISSAIEKNFNNRFLVRFTARDIFKTSLFTTDYTNQNFDYTYSYRPKFRSFILSATYTFGKRFSSRRVRGTIIDDIKEKSVK